MGGVLYKPDRYLATEKQLLMIKSLARPQNSYKQAFLQPNLMYTQTEYVPGIALPTWSMMLLITWTITMTEKLATAGLPLGSSSVFLLGAHF